MCVCVEREIQKLSCEDGDVVLFVGLWIDGEDRG